MRIKITMTVIFVAVSTLLILPSIFANRVLAQDPNATLPSKPKPETTSKTTTPKRTTGRGSARTGNANNKASDEIAFWNSIKKSTDPEDFKAYLKQYPYGRFAALAKNRLKNLEAAKSPPPSNTTLPNANSPNSSAANMPRMRINQAGIEFVLIPPGSFMMGSQDRGHDEKPVHQVTINYSFYMGKYEVTQAQWRAVMGNDPSDFKDCGNCPAEQVTWNDAQDFLQRLNHTNDGYFYRLPTEAEWEYSCQAGTTTPFAFGYSLSSDQANFDGEYPEGGGKGVYRQKAIPVGSFQPNAWGLYDMHGNVWEWCQDWYHDDYDGAPADGSAWLSGSEQKRRVLRGGSWQSIAADLRSASRYSYPPDIRYLKGLGIRVVAVMRTQ